MELISLYPYDPTARATSNKIVNESITVIPPSQVTDYSYVVPRAAPFFAETLVVKDGKGVGARTLVENVDYWCVIDFLSASVGLTKRVSVGIALLNPSYSGTLYVSYQCLGGNYTMADYSVLEELIRERYIVKHVSYEQIINLPAGFSPEWHNHEIDDMVGMSSVVESLNGIKTATQGRNGSYGQIEKQIQDHMNSSAAHRPVDVGLGNVKNYTVGTLNDAKNGTINKYVTTDILKQYVAFSERDLSHLLTKTDAQNTYALISSLNSYYTKSTSDSRYAYKSDTYNKTDIDNMFANIDVGDVLEGYYSKQQSDARFLPKSEISSYIKTTVADGRYASKSELGNYYNKTESNVRYALKSASYTKVESDGRYLTNTDLSNALSNALSPYLTTSSASSTYQTKSAMNNYYDKSHINSTGVTGVTWSPLGDNYSHDYELKILFNKGDGSRSYVTESINLVDHYTKREVDEKITNSDSGVYHKKFSVTNSYRSYNALNVEWSLLYSPSAGTASISAVVTSPFYIDEDYTFMLTTGAAPYRSGSNSSTSEQALSFYADNAIRNIDVDYDVRPGSELIKFEADGELKISVSFSTDSSGDYKYTQRLFATATIPITNTNNHKKIMQWFRSSDKWVAPK